MKKMKFVFLTAFMLAAIFMFPMLSEAAEHTVKMQNGASIRTLQDVGSGYPQAMRFMIRVYSSDFAELESKGVYGIELSFENPHNKQLIKEYISSDKYSKIYRSGSDGEGDWKEYVVVVSGFTKEYFETKITAKGFIDLEKAVVGDNVNYAADDLYNEPLPESGVTRSILEVAENTGHALTVDGPLLKKETLDLNGLIKSGGTGSLSVGAEGLTLNGEVSSVIGVLNQEVLPENGVQITIAGENLAGVGICLGNKQDMTDFAADGSVTPNSDNSSITTRLISGNNVTNNALCIQKQDGGNLPTNFKITSISVVFIGENTDVTIYEPETTGSNEPEYSPTPVPRFTLIDFEDQDLEKAYSYTSGDSSPDSVKVVADPSITDEKSLRVTANGYNQAAIVPIYLPYEVKNYKTFSFRLRLLDGVDLSNNEFCVYIANDTSAFKKWGFGNGSGESNQFIDYLVGKTEQISWTDEHKAKWTDYVITVNPSAAIENLKGDLYLALGSNYGKKLDYLMDDLRFDMQDSFSPTPQPTKPPAPVPASIGAAISGEYRNLFREFGKSDVEINAKLDDTWQKLFYGTEDERIYYPVGDDKAYIYTADTDDVRSEGMSYGMMICVQLNKQEEFDRLWNWAKTYMYNSEINQDCRAYFAWQCNTNGTKKDRSAAPDGEMYFVTSLLFASNRWGDGEGVYNYGKEARQILFDMLRRYDGKTSVEKLDPYDAPTMFNLNNYMPVFVPKGNSASHTDPSYHLPAFYDVW
ncbi:MAG: hypothetical protein LBR68_07920, partial [Lachnoclostridium sp.]|nr:hypothetical protein [Lachnoclostridium sp.]